MRATPFTGLEMLTVHASTVAFGKKAVMIRGASGSGKSSLALTLLSMGAELIADDQTILTRSADQLIADCPGPISGQIEARGIGILNAPRSAPKPLSLIVDLDKVNTIRLPQLQVDTILGVRVTVVCRCESSAFAAGIKLYTLYGRAH